MTLENALKIAQMSVKQRSEVGITDEDLRQAVTRLRTTVGSTRRAVEARWGSTVQSPIYRALDERLDKLAFAKSPAKQMSHNQLTAVIAAYKPFYIGDDGEPTKTRTASGYKASLVKTEESIGIPGYSTWDESERKEFWDLVKELKAYDGGLFDSIRGAVAKGKAGADVWTSGTTYQKVEEIRNEHPEWTAEQIISQLKGMKLQYEHHIETPMPDFR